MWPHAVSEVLVGIPPENILSPPKGQYFLTWPHLCDTYGKGARITSGSQVGSGIGSASLLSLTLSRRRLRGPSHVLKLANRQKFCTYMWVVNKMRKGRQTRLCIGVRHGMGGGKRMKENMKV
jgi:hypothetical protein